MTMISHKNISGDQLHVPQGKNPTPLDLDNNISSAYQIRWDTDGTLTTYRDAFVIDTSDGNLRIQIGNTTDAFSLDIAEIATPGSPASGIGRLYFDSSDSRLKALNASGNITDLVGYTRETVTGTTTLTAENRVIALKVAAAATVTLRPAATAKAGAWLLFVDELGNAATNNVTIDPAGSETIDGSASLKIFRNYGWALIYTDGSNWFVAGRSPDFTDGGEAAAADRTLGNTDAYALSLLTNNQARIHVKSTGEVGVGMTGQVTTLGIGGSLAVGYETKSGSATLTATSCYVGMNHSANATITLPAASAAGAGRLIIVKDESGAAATNKITVAAAGADTIDGAADQQINSNYGALTLIGNGVDSWAIV